MAFKKSEVVRGLDKPFPSTSCTVRITAMEKTRSSAGNPMVTTDIEIVAPQVISHAGDTIQLAGLTGRLFGMLDPTSPYGLAKLLGALERAQLDPAEIQGLGEDELFEADDPAKLRAFIGKTFQITLTCKPRVTMRQPTPEERAAGVKPEPLKDKQGKELTAGNQLDCDWGNVTGPAVDESEEF